MFAAPRFGRERNAGKLAELRALAAPAIELAAKPGTPKKRHSLSRHSLNVGYPPQGAPPPVPTAGKRTRYRDMVKLRLAVEQHVPIHGRAGPNSEVLKIVGNTN